MSSSDAEVRTFYHFTRGITLAHILHDENGGGLTKGDVRTTHQTGFNAVWLTTDPNPENFKCRGFPVIEQHKKQARITVKLSANDPSLRKWRDVVKDYKIEEQLAKKIETYSGGDPKDHWLYRGKIGVDCFVSVDLRLENGQYQTFTASQKHPDWGDEPWGALLKTLGNRGYTVQSMLLEPFPDPEPGWPDREATKKKCANQKCTADPQKKVNLICARCRQVQYCSKKCQLEHYKEHKVFCRTHDPSNPAAFQAGMFVYKKDKP